MKIAEVGMKIVEVEAREYGEIFAKPTHVYNLSLIHISEPTRP